ncbi:F-box/kelch-repeat protein At3g23880-like [Chenopodium quinoa]|uniref:F-box domain-containing protein n=1 Tax=Chenopodium quinoa TaxID=63459 RepID=A0A803LMX6_CHEQI|nr:F-box/kelch-repeat protein At3g23880-like [Chenopodium quinoa]
MEQTTAKSESELPTLPDDVIVEMILPRLPVKPLTRFKCVSKFWLSTISSNRFAKTHLKFSSLSNTKSVIYKELYSFRNRGSYLSFDERYDMKEFVTLDDKYSNNNDPRYTRRARVVGSCNGLLCMFDSDVLEFTLWNPVTKQYHNAGGPEFNYVLNDDVAGVGFGYIPSIDDYKIGCLVHSEEGVCRVSVYSLKTGEWKETSCIEEKGFISIDRRYYSVLVDDTIYWSPIVRRESEDQESHIVGLNLVNGLLTKVPLGNLLTGYFDAKVFERKGCLSLCCNSVVIGRRRRTKHVSDVWTLKNNGDKQSWEKSFSINIKGVILLYIFESGKCLVSRHLNQLMLLNLSQAEYVEVTVIWQRHRRGHVYHRAIADVWDYTESLISPSGISARVVNEDDRETGERVEENA